MPTVKPIKRYNRSSPRLLSVARVNNLSTVKSAGSVAIIGNRKKNRLAGANSRMIAFLGSHAAHKSVCRLHIGADSGFDGCETKSACRGRWPRKSRKNGPKRRNTLAAITCPGLSPSLRSWDEGSRSQTQKRSRGRPDWLLKLNQASLLWSVRPQLANGCKDRLSMSTEVGISDTVEQLRQLLIMIGR